MDQNRTTFAGVISQGKRLAQHLLKAGENRLELWSVEMQEEREDLSRMVILGMGVAIFSLMTGIALSGCVVVLLWDYSPFLAFGSLALAYGIIAKILYNKLGEKQKNWKPFEATLEQLKKDRLCLEKSLT
jgi:uncharacterized membrane protein YqjE